MTIDRTRGYRIYRNLNADNWTVQHYVVGKGWRKWRSADILWSPRVVFKVSKTGQQRVVREGRKNVHAYALCTEIEFANEHPENAFTIKYNPYVCDSFTASVGNNPPKRVDSAQMVDFTEYGTMRATWITRIGLGKIA